MKKIKYLLWLIILGLLGILIYQNLDYFMTTRALKFDLKIASWNWTMPELQNIAYFGICFLLGLILVGIKGFVVKLRLKKEIKTKDAAVASLKEQVNTLKTELEVFQHDPYIKKELEEKTIVDLPVLDQPENDTEKGDKSDTAV
ncbi:LapA family protein [Desulfobacula sp.]|uniref:LapA family protein n=1 Tax=Desulfobacula sp. TaxID=2593537 RepID=UPI0025C2345F|nr:LapA family protein [Desulfobacula sp.]MBC2703350.1 LapA family protein [Desulfobacula sp.]